MKRTNYTHRSTNGFWGVGGSDAPNWRRTEPLQPSSPVRLTPRQAGLQDSNTGPKSAPISAAPVGDEAGAKSRKLHEADSPSAERTVKPDRELTDLQKTFLTVQIPPADVDVPPRVEHVIAKRDGLLSEIVSTQLDLPVWFIRELIRFGAVYSCPVHPLPPESMKPSAEHLEMLKQIRRDSMRIYGRHPNQQQPKRLVMDHHVTVNSYIRVHVHPKRFPAFYTYKWGERVIWEGDGCVVVNKPPGCQVCSRVDNSIESVCAWVTKELKLPSELMTTHRLDMGTEGVVVLAKTREFASYFNKTICKKDRVKKVYRALSECEPCRGRLIHYMMVGQRGPGEPAHTVICGGDEPGSLYAELIVLRVDRVQLTGEAREQWGPEAFESLIELKTGRTHQIRAQLAAVGCPLFGDNLYKAVATKENHQSQLIDTAALDLESLTIEEDGVRLSYSAGQCDCIGLQAFRLEIHDSRAPEYFGRSAPRYFEAGVPWWRVRAGW